MNISTRLAKLESMTAPGSCPLCSNPIRPVVLLPFPEPDEPAQTDVTCSVCGRVLMVMGVVTFDDRDTIGEVA